MCAEFSDYNTYLAVSYATNLMFWIWEKFPKTLLGYMTRHNSVMIKKLVANVAGTNDDTIRNARSRFGEQQDSYKKSCEKHVCFGKRVSILFAIIIGISLYIFAGYDYINSVYVWIIFFAPSPPILTMFAMSFLLLRRTVASRIGVAGIISIIGDPALKPKKNEIGIKTAWEITRKSNGDNPKAITK